MALRKKFEPYYSWPKNNNQAFFFFDSIKIQVLVDQCFRDAVKTDKTDIKTEVETILKSANDGLAALGKGTNSGNFTLTLVHFSSIASLSGKYHVSTTQQNL